MMPPQENPRAAQLAAALFRLAKASAEYAALPALQRERGIVNPAFSGELLQIMRDAAQEIADYLLAPPGQP